MILGGYYPQSGITRRPRAIATKNIDEKQKETREEEAGASVQVGSGEDTMSITSTTEEAAPTTGHQEQPNNEHPSDQWKVSTYPYVVLHTHRF